MPPDPPLFNQLLDLNDDTRSPSPQMIHRSSPPKMLAPVPKEWQPYTLDAAYTFVACLPSSPHRHVIAARHASGETCSVQKFSGVGLDSSRAKICLKELRMLRHLRAHRNIVCAYDMSFSIHENGRVADVYLYTELPRSNLASILKTRKNLTKGHVQYLMYQLCCAVRHIHSAGIIHGAIQPSNILVDSDISLRVCDFSNAQTWNGNSLSRGSNPSLCTTGGSVIYKAPELLLGVSKVSFAVDIWSIGCILAEFLNGGPLFDRNDLPGQIRTLLARLGKPPEEVLKRIASPQTVQNIGAIRNQSPPSIRELFPSANDAEMQLIHQTLLWDPMARSASTDLLDGIYFTQWRNAADEAVSHMAFRNDTDLETNQDAINQLIMSEVTSFHKMVRQAGHEGSREDGFRNPTARLSTSHHSQPQTTMGLSYFDGSEEDGEFEWAPDA